jgi:hypothetical protein
MLDETNQGDTVSKEKRKKMKNKSEQTCKRVVNGRSQCTAKPVFFPTMQRAGRSQAESHPIKHQILARVANRRSQAIMLG